MTIDLYIVRMLDHYEHSIGHAPIADLWHDCCEITRNTDIPVILKSFTSQFDAVILYLVYNKYINVKHNRCNFTVKGRWWQHYFDEKSFIDGWKELHSKETAKSLARLMKKHK